MDSATWAAWTQGILALIAFSATILIWRSDVQRSSKQERALQASRIAAWTESEILRREMKTRVKLIFLNASETPVYDVRAKLAIAVLGGTFVESKVEIGVVPPGRREVVYTFDYVQSEQNAAFMSFVFRDALNVAWLRSRTGMLLDLGEAPPELTSLQSRDHVDRYGIWESFLTNFDKNQKE